MSIELLERGAQALGPVLGDVVFLGGASLVLWITDPGAPAPRPTKDVDVVVEVASRTAFHEFEQRLRGLGFREDQEEGVICRWRHRDDGLILDAMPSDAALLGFENRWQGASIPHAVERTLPSGTSIRATPPAYLLATKIEAFNGRGKEDFLGSRDFGDAIALIDGCEELVPRFRAPSGSCATTWLANSHACASILAFARGSPAPCVPTSQARRERRRWCSRAWASSPTRGEGVSAVAFRARLSC